MAKQQREPGSWGPLPLAVMQDQRLTMADKAVYAAIVVVAHGRPKCDISRSVLAQLSSTSKSTVARSLVNLESAEWVLTESAPGYLSMVTLLRQGESTPPIALEGVSQLRGSAVTVGHTPVTVRGSQFTAESGANPPYRERDQESREAVANAPWGDDEREKADQRYKSLLNGIRGIEVLIRGNYVSPPSLPVHELPYEATHNGRSLINWRPMPEGLDQFGEPIDPSKPKTKAKPGKPPEPTASGTF